MTKFYQLRNLDYCLLWTLEELYVITLYFPLLLLLLLSSSSSSLLLLS